MIQRPWGGYECLYRDATHQVKKIVVLPGMRFSLQKHLKRSEKWVILSGVGVATIGDKNTPISEGLFLDVPCGQIHRMQNTGKTPLEFIEVQFGTYLEEDDIVRLEDDFGRA